MSELTKEQLAQVKKLHADIIKSQGGSIAVEYALLVALIAVVSAVGIKAFGAGVDASFDTLKASLETAGLDMTP